MMSLRESTLPQIAKTLRQNSNLPKELKSKVESMIKKAKVDVDDFYGEVTYRSQRKVNEKKLKAPPPPKLEKKTRGTSAESTTASEQKKKLDRLLKKRTLELGEVSDGDETINGSELQEDDESESMKMSSCDEDDDDEGKKIRKEKKQQEGTLDEKAESEEDKDLFEGTRFSPGSLAGSGSATPTPTNGGRVGFDRTLQEMISKAVECGALASDAGMQVNWGEGSSSGYIKEKPKSKPIYYLNCLLFLGYCFNW